MKRHAGSQGTTPKRKRRSPAKKARRTKAIKKAQNVLLRNTPESARDWVRINVPWSGRTRYAPGSRQHRQAQEARNTPEQKAA